MLHFAGIFRSLSTLLSSFLVIFVISPADEAFSTLITFPFLYIMQLSSHSEPKRDQKEDEIYPLVSKTIDQIKKI